MKPIIIIPNYNDNEHIDQLVSDVTSYTDTPILIIDDGSNPKLGKVNSVFQLSNTKNRGKGYSLLKAFKHAKLSGFTHAITIDADMQHPPKHIIEFILSPEDDIIVFGCRLFNNSMPPLRRLSNTITTKLISKIIKNRDIKDSQCGYRRYHIDSVLAFKYKEKGFQFETEVILNLSSVIGFKIANIDIDTIYSNEKSSISKTFDTIKFIKLIIRRLCCKNI